MFNEVKSATRGGSYEYQYHKWTGKEKLVLRKDMEVGHLFFDHADNLRHGDLRYAHGSWMKHFFNTWLENYPDPYPQRHRRNIPYKWVKENGVLLMTLTDGEVTYPKIAPADKSEIPQLAESVAEPKAHPYKPRRRQE